MTSIPCISLKTILIRLSPNSLVKISLLEVKMSKNVRIAAYENMKGTLEVRKRRDLLCLEEVELRELNEKYAVLPNKHFLYPVERLHSVSTYARAVFSFL